MDENILVHIVPCFNAPSYKFHYIIRWPIKLSSPFNPRQSRHIKLCWSFENIRIVIWSCCMTLIIWHIPLPTHVPLLIKQSIWPTTEKYWNLALNKGYAEVLFLEYSLPGNTASLCPNRDKYHRTSEEIDRDHNGNKNILLSLFESHSKD